MLVHLTVDLSYLSVAVAVTQLGRVRIAANGLWDAEQLGDQHGIGVAIRGQPVEEHEHRIVCRSELRHRLALSHHLLASPLLRGCPRRPLPSTWQGFPDSAPKTKGGPRRPRASASYRARSGPAGQDWVCGCGLGRSFPVR